MKKLSNFSKVSLSKSEMKQITGGIIIRTTPGGKYCPRELSDDEREACMAGR
jgi:natural product precursor